MLSDSNYQLLLPYRDLIFKTNELKQEISNAPRELMGDIWNNNLRGEYEGLANLNCGDCIMRLYEQIYIHMVSYETTKFNTTNNN